MLFTPAIVLFAPGWRGVQDPRGCRIHPSASRTFSSVAVLETSESVTWERTFLYATGLIAIIHLRRALASIDLIVCAFALDGFPSRIHACARNKRIRKSSSEQYAIVLGLPDSP